MERKGPHEVKNVLYRSLYNTSALSTAFSPVEASIAVPVPAMPGSKKASGTWRRRRIPEWPLRSLLEVWVGRVAGTWTRGESLQPQKFPSPTLATFWKLSLICLCYLSIINCFIISCFLWEIIWHPFTPSPFPVNHTVDDSYSGWWWNTVLLSLGRHWTKSINRYLLCFYELFTLLKKNFRIRLLFVFLNENYTSSYSSILLCLVSLTNQVHWLEGMTKNDQEMILSKKEGKGKGLSVIPSTPVFPVFMPATHSL